MSLSPVVINRVSNSDSLNPLVFIGSSAENHEVALAIQQNLAGKEIDDHSKIEVQVWDQGVFEIGGGTLDTLIKKAKEYDFAVIVFGKDSKVEERGKSYIAPRDNVVFELGLFIATLGAKRTFVVRDSEVKLPSDLAGVTVGRFEDPQRSGWQAALAPACQAIINQIRSVTQSEKKPEHKLTLTDKYAAWWDKAQSARTGTEVVQTMEGLTMNVSSSTFSPDVRLTYSPIVVYNQMPQDMGGMRVLDLGTGCGILAIAAALRGARQVVAVDIAHGALEDVRSNRERLIKEGRIRPKVIKTLESNLFEKVEGEFDYILANLPISAYAKTWEYLKVEETIRNCVKGLNDKLKPNGKAIFAWASFGPPELIPELLHEEGFKFRTSAPVETFGVTWYAYVVTRG